MITLISERSPPYDWTANIICIFHLLQVAKNLDNKTLKAYQIDLKQFVDFYPKPTTVTRTDMELYIEHLMERYKASTVKRKIAALKAYYHYLVYEEILEHSPFEKFNCIFARKFYFLELLIARYLVPSFPPLTANFRPPIPKLLTGKQLEISPCLSFCSLVGYAFPSFVQSPAITWI